MNNYNNIEKCKQEIKDYLIKNGWNGKGCINPLFREHIKGYISINISYFFYGEHKNVKLIEKSYNPNDCDIEEGAKYLSEYIGHILRKYNITKVIVSAITCESTNWTFDSIKTTI